MKRILSILTLSLLISCNIEPTDIFDEDNGGSGAAEVTVMELKSLYRTSTQQIVEDITIEGLVVANDMFGEFCNRIFIQDESGGIEIYVDGDELFNDYPLYNRVKIYCSGLWLAKRGGSDGTLVMGDYPTSYDVVDMISTTNFTTRIQSNATSSEPFTPESYTLSEIDESLVSSSFVIESLRFVDVESFDSLFDYEQYDEYGYCRRTLECELSGESIGLYLPSTLSYRDVVISLIERDRYLVILDRYYGSYTLQLVGMGSY